MTSNPFNSLILSQIDTTSTNIKLIRSAYQIAYFCHPKEPKKLAKVFLRSIFKASISFNWYQFIANSPLLNQLVNVNKQLAEKPHRHQLRLDACIKLRYQLLINHYTTLNHLFDAQFLAEILLTNGIVIGEILVPTEERFSLSLEYGGNESKEGELTISLRLIGQPILANIRFSLLTTATGVTLYIGGLQGAQIENSKEYVSKACKLLSGLSPSRLVLETCLAFACQIGATQILAVSDTQQISNKKSNKHLSYDKYWQDIGGVPTDTGDYQLPLLIARKLREETPTKRRAKYRRQHAHLDDIHSACAETIPTKFKEVEQCKKYY